MNLPVAEAVLMDPMNAALNHPVAQPAPVAQVAQVAQPAQVVQVAQVAQPSPVSMFDLVPGRRYIISNRQVDAGHYPIRQAPAFNSYRPNQSTFVATFICLSRPLADRNDEKGFKFHPIKLLEGVDLLESEIGVPPVHSLYTGRSLQMLMANSDVYPIFSYEQGLDEELLEDLTLELELAWIKGNMAAGGGGPGVRQRNEYRILQSFNMMLMPTLTEHRDTQRIEVIEGYEAQMFNRTKREALPGLLYFGHDEHSQLYKNYSRSVGGRGEAHIEERNFKYSLLKRWSTQWYSKPPQGVRQRSNAVVGGLPQAVRDAGYTSFAETFFNAPELLGGNLPNLTPIKRELLRHNLMIVLPRYWSFTYDPQYQDDLQPGEAEVMAGRIRGGDVHIGQNPRRRRERAVRRALDGGKRTRKKKSRKTKKRKQTRRRRRKRN